MKTLVISDAHNRISEVSKIISQNPDANLIVSLGDWFDSFFEDENSTELTARYLKNLTEQRNFVWLLGNHDASYFFPECDYLWCRGQTLKKQAAIQKVFGKQKPFKLFHWDEYYLYTHAGVNPYFIPKDGFCPDKFQERVDVALLNLNRGVYDELVGPGISRGGRQTYGGITWQDYDEFVPTPGLNQIFGHTQSREPRQILGENSVNWCLDTQNRHYAVVENSRITIHEL